jgi:hypothetical protein
VSCAELFALKQGDAFEAVVQLKASFSIMVHKDMDWCVLLKKAGEGDVEGAMVTEHRIHLLVCWRRMGPTSLLTTLSHACILRKGAGAINRPFCVIHHYLIQSNPTMM